MQLFLPCIVWVTLVYRILAGLWHSDWTWSREATCDRWIILQLTFQICSFLHHFLWVGTFYKFYRKLCQSKQLSQLCCANEWNIFIGLDVPRYSTTKNLKKISFSNFFHQESKNKTKIQNIDYLRFWLFELWIFQFFVYSSKSSWYLM